MSDVEKMARAIWMASRPINPAGILNWDAMLDEYKEQWRVYARAALSALGGWQPIETAPVDCSNIILAHCWNRLTRVEVCVAESGPAAFITPQADIPRGSDRLLGWMQTPDTSALRQTPKGPAR